MTKLPRVSSRSPNQETSISQVQSLLLEASISLPDAYLALPMIVTAQIIALDTSIKVANKPDTPSPTGTVNRVVKGVIIHEYVNKGETKDE